MVRYLDNQPPSPVSDLSRQHLENMRVGQARVHTGDVRFYVTTANGHVVRGPYLNREQAEGALEQIRERERQQSKEEDE